MRSLDIVSRARSAAGLKTKYVLGGGKMTPTGSNPKDERGGCDCSAFVCWVLMIEKHQPMLAWLKRVNGGWYNTDGIWWDGKKERTGCFDVVAYPFAKPGDVIVYPGRGLSGSTPSIGHVGIITAVRGEATVGDREKFEHIAKVIHCSSGNYRTFGDAIAETGPEVFRRSSSIVVRSAAFEE